MIQPFEKKMGKLELRGYLEGFPHTVTLSKESDSISLFGEDEIRDVHYALGRVIAVLDEHKRNRS